MIYIYIHITYGGCCEYVNGSGNFSDDRKVALIGTIVNIVFSVLLVYRRGIEGVLIGTVISQLFFWIGRSAIVYFRLFQLGWSEYAKYVQKNIIWAMSVLCIIIGISFIARQIITYNQLVRVIEIFLLCEVMIGLLQLLCFHNSEEQKLVFHLIKQ